MSSERRQHPRADVQLVVYQRLGNRRVARQVSSMSAGGLFLQWPEARVRPADLLVLELELPGGETMKLTAEVVHVTDEGVGVRVTRADWRRLSRLAGIGCDER